MTCDNLAACIKTNALLTMGYTWYIILRQPNPSDFIYYDTTYKNIGMPYTLFALKVSNGIVTDIRIMCSKARIITEDTTMFAYPFSNVGTQGGVCLGHNRINYPLDTIYSILNIPEMFLAMPNSEHNYGHNLSGLYYRDMLKELEGKPFKEEWLTPNNMTFKSFIGTLR